MAFGIRNSGLFVTTAVCLVAAAPAFAQQRQFNVPAQDARTGIPEFARQAGIQISAPTGRISGVRTNAVKGKMDVQAALRLLIAGTKLEIASTGNGVVALRRADTQPGNAPGAAEQAAAAPVSANTTTSLSGDAVPNGGEAIESGAISEILVTGRRPTLNADIRRSEDDSQPYVVIDRKEIERSSASTTEQLLRQTLSMETSSTSPAQGPNQTNSTSVALRGLSSRETLILIDGRRVSSVQLAGSLTQADISGIPLSAIERIEVLPTTSAGQYGGGATAGVINIVLRRDFSGADLKATVEFTADGGGSAKKFDFTGGKSFNGGDTSIMVSGSVSLDDPLRLGQRDYYERGIETILENAPQSLLGNLNPPPGIANPPLGRTTNIRSSTGANLTLKAGGSVGSSITFVPYGYAGTASDGGAALIANAGQFTFDLANTAQRGGARRNLLNTPDRWSLNASARHRFSDRVSIFAEVARAHTSGSFTDNPSTGTYTLAASSAANPFNETIRITMPLIGADQERRSKIDNTRFLFGGIFKLTGDWRLSADYSWSRHSWKLREAAPVTTALVNAAIASGDLDPFRDVNAFSTDFSPYLAVPTIYEPVHSTAQNLAIRASGSIPFIRLPGGAPSATVLIEGRREKLGEFTFIPSGVTTPITSYPRSQDIAAVYGEAKFPVVSPDNGISGIHLLEFQVAARAEHYKLNGSNQSIDGPRKSFVGRFSSVDPTMSFRYGPVQDLTFRGSYGTGFLPPELAVIWRFPTFVEPFPGTTDPLRGDELIENITGTFDANVDLDPEQSRSLSLGAILQPRFLHPLRLSVDWTRVRKSDVIRILDPIYTQSDLETIIQFFPERITRSTDPTTFGSFGVGPITAIESGFLNLSEAEFEAIDFSGDYGFSTPRLGDFRFYVKATRALINRSRATPEAPVEDQLGTLSQLVWRWNGGFSWQLGGLTVDWDTRYFDSYFVNLDHSVDPRLGSAKVKDQIYHDLSVRYRFGDRFGPALRGVEIGAGARNIFNKAPPVSLLRPDQGYYSFFGDPRGAVYRLTVRKSL